MVIDQDRLKARLRELQEQEAQRLNDIVAVRGAIQQVELFLRELEPPQKELADVKEFKKPEVTNG